MNISGGSFTRERSCLIRSCRALSGIPAKGRDEPDVARHRHVRKEADMLDHIPCRPPQFDRIEALDVGIIDQDSPLVRLHHAVHHPEHGGLAASGRTDQHEEFTGTDLQVEVVYCSDRTIPFCDPIEPDARRAFSPEGRGRDGIPPRLQSVPGRPGTRVLLFPGLPCLYRTGCSAGASWPSRSHR